MDYGPCLRRHLCTGHVEPAQPASVYDRARMEKESQRKPYYAMSRFERGRGLRLISQGLLTFNLFSPITRVPHHFDTHDNPRFPHHLTCLCLRGQGRCLLVLVPQMLLTARLYCHGLLCAMRCHFPEYTKVAQCLDLALRTCVTPRPAPAYTSLWTFFAPTGHS